MTKLEVTSSRVAEVIVEVPARLYSKPISEGYFSGVKSNRPFWTKEGTRLCFKA